MYNTIGETIRRLRRDSEMTQEKLAEHLGVSINAVSKWERGECMPDISLLVPLAKLFCITTDELLGRKDDAAEREVTEFIEKYEKIVHFAHEYAEEHSVTLWEAFDVSLEEGRALMKKYPDDYRLKNKVCHILFFAPKESDGDEAYWNARNSELTDLAEKILAECTDSKYRNEAIWYLVATYPYQNRYDKVKELAEIVPNMYTCREAVLCDAAEYGSDEHRMYSELYLKRSMENVHFELSHFYNDYNTNKFPPEQVLALTEVEWNISHAYYDHGDFDARYTCNLFGNRLCAARAALTLSRPEDAVRKIGEALDMLAASIANDSKVFTSSAMTRTGERRPYPKVYDHKEIRREFSRFAESEAACGFRETAEFAALRSRLEEILA